MTDDTREKLAELLSERLRFTPPWFLVGKDGSVLTGLPRDYELPREGEEDC